MNASAPGARRLSLLLLALVGVGTLLLPTTARAASFGPSSYASRLLSLVNQAREQHGLRPLVETSGTSCVAAAWTSHLAAAQALSHNPDLQSQLESHGSRNWTTFGENVGEGGAQNPDSLFRAYMASPEHRANILTSAYRYVGVGVVITGGTAWNTFDFVDAYGTPAPRPVVHHHHAARTAVIHRSAPTRVVHHDAVPATVAPARHAPRPAPARSHHPARAHRHPVIRVEGLQARSPAPHPHDEALVVAAVPTAASQLTGPAASALPRAFLVGLAVLVLAAIGRRWVLTVAR